MKKEIKISAIVIDLGDKKLELNMEKAEELKKVLNDTFPEKEIQYVLSQFTCWSSSCGGIGQTSYSGTLNLALSS